MTASAEIALNPSTRSKIKKSPVIAQVHRLHYSAV